MVCENDNNSTDANYFADAIWLIAGTGWTQGSKGRRNSAVLQILGPVGGLACKLLILNMFEIFGLLGR